LVGIGDFKLENFLEFKSEIFFVKTLQNHEKFKIFRSKRNLRLKKLQKPQKFMPEDYQTRKIPTKFCKVEKIKQF
jgi:hypothetical protein